MYMRCTLKTDTYSAESGAEAFCFKEERGENLDLKYPHGIHGV